MKIKLVGGALLGLFAFVATISGSSAADRWGLSKIGPELKSAGSLAMGPDGILLVADPMQAAVLAIQTHASDSKNNEDLRVENLTQEIAEKASVDPGQVTIKDLAVNQQANTAFISVDINDGKETVGQVWEVNSNTVRPLELTKLSYAKLDMPNPPADQEAGEGRRRRNPRMESITGITYSEGRVLVSGLSADNDPSSVWEFQFPFSDSNSAANVEIYHAAHGRYEDSAAIRTFVTMNIGGKPSLLAGYTCTPLVKLPLDAIQQGSKIRGTTVAELGNRNQPLDMLVYESGGRTYVLMSNSARGMMRISTEGIEGNEGLTEPVKNGGSAGQSFESIDSLSNVTKMDRLGTNKLVALVKKDDNSFALSTFELP